MLSQCFVTFYAICSVIIENNIFTKFLSNLYYKILDRTYAFEMAISSELLHRFCSNNDNMF